MADYWCDDGLDKLPPPANELEAESLLPSENQGTENLGKLKKQNKKTPQNVKYEFITPAKVHLSKI